jgi:hypothetical protein
MATFLRRKAAVVTLGVLTLTLAGGGIAAAAQPAVKARVGAVQAGGAQQPGHQPPVTAAQSQAAKAALRLAAAPPAAGTVAWAVVSENGTLLQHSPNVTGAFRFPCCGGGVSAGQYQVTLDYDVHLKSYQATIGTSDPNNVPPGGEVSVAPRYLIPNAVFVQTRNSTGGFADRHFHILITN